MPTKTLQSEAEPSTASPVEEPVGGNGGDGGDCMTPVRAAGSVQESTHVALLYKAQNCGRL